MHTDTDPNLEQLHVAVQLLREWADHCHNHAATETLSTGGGAEDDAPPASELLPLHHHDRQAIYRYGYAVAIEDAAAFLDDLLNADVR